MQNIFEEEAAAEKARDGHRNGKDRVGEIHVVILNFFPVDGCGCGPGKCF